MEMEIRKNEEYITEEEARALKELFRKYLKSYQEREASVSDKEWLEQLFGSELSDFAPEVRKQDAEDIVKYVHIFNDNLASVNEAANSGVSKESWLADKLQELSVGMAVNEYGSRLQEMDTILTEKNLELADALAVSLDGDIKRIHQSKNLDGQLEKEAQEKGVLPKVDYSHYQTRDLAMSIGKNAGALAFQAAAVTTGLNAAYKLFQGEKVEANEWVENAIRTGTDTSVKVVIAGTLQIAIRKGIMKFLPQMLESGVIAIIVCVGIENGKVFVKITTGELTVARGLDQMGRITVSMIGAFWDMAKGGALWASLSGWIPVIGVPLAVATGFVGGMAGYLGGSKLGDMVYSGAKKIFHAAKNAGKAAVSALKSAARKMGNKVSKLTKAIFS